LSRRAVINASPLIYLAKISLLRLLDDIYDEILTTDIVIKECVEKGKEAGYEDAIIIERHTKKGLIKIIALSAKKRAEARRLAKEAKIHIGEATVILLAKSEGIDNIIVDDKKARKVARIHNLKPRGTLSVILELVIKRRLSKEEAKKYIDKLIRKGFRVSIEVYNKIIGRLKG